MIIAQTGKRVLLIDADMRRGYLHRIFGLQPKHGLSDTLAARRRCADVITPTRIRHRISSHVVSRPLIRRNC